MSSTIAHHLPFPHPHFGRLFDTLLAFLYATIAIAAATVARRLHIVDNTSPTQTPSDHDTTSNEKQKDSSPTYIVIPDLVSHCKFPLARHPNGDEITAASTNWLIEGCPELSPRRKAALRGLQAGTLTAYCYPWCPPERMRVVADFLGYLFHLDNISDDMMTKETDTLANFVMNAHWFPEKYVPCKQQPDEEISAGKLARDYWTRCIADAKPLVQARFKETFAEFFESVNLQARDRDAGIIPDVESFIEVRRDTSGCKSSFDLLEYAMDIELPEEVHGHPVIEALRQGSNDLVAWSNDIFSYNVEQSRGDEGHNLIPIFMTHHNMTLQEAFDKVGELCREGMNAFEENLRHIPSFGDEQLDRDVQTYVRGLQDWIVGSLHWSFVTERYFGKDGPLVKKTRIIKMLERRSETD